MNKQSFVVWMTGLSGAGKTTLAEKLNTFYQGQGYSVEHLDGDSVRSVFPQIGFSKEERNEHIKRIGFVASLLEKHGVVVICSFISPYSSSREVVRQMCHHFIEVFVNTSLEECERRDVKGLYKKARRGEIKQFTGVDDPYEPPQHSEIILDTEGKSIEESFKELVKKINVVRRHFKE